MAGSTLINDPERGLLRCWDCHRMFPEKDIIDVKGHNFCSLCVPAKKIWPNKHILTCPNCGKTWLIWWFRKVKWKCSKCGIWLQTDRGESKEAKQ